MKVPIQIEMKGTNFKLKYDRAAAEMEVTTVRGAQSGKRQLGESALPYGGQRPRQRGDAEVGAGKGRS